jgi:hypothetical protein
METLIIVLVAVAVAELFLIIRLFSRTVSLAKIDSKTIGAMTMLLEKVQKGEKDARFEEIFVHAVLDGLFKHLNIKPDTHTGGEIVFNKIK